jgi:hypothetical protein
MPAYVDQYLRLEDKATSEESHAEDYRARADQDRWEQCRIVHEAIDSGDYNQASFGREVGRHGTHIGRQYRAYEMFGQRARRPSYSEAIAAADGTTPEAETERKSLSHATRVMSDPKLAKQVLEDPDVRRKLMANDRIRSDLNRTSREIDAQRAARVARKQRQNAPDLAEAREYYDAMGRLVHARQDINKALDLLRGIPPLDNDQRDELRQVTGWIGTSLDWLNETLKARRTATLADEIETYLADQEA